MKLLRSLSYLLILSSASLVAPAQVMYNSIPSRIIGQPVLQQQGVITSVAPNLVEGRELYNPEGVAVDTSAAPNILYVADTSNNRVLAWKNAAAFTKGDFADKVIGQRDFLSTSPQGPSVTNTTLSAGLNLPIALAVDKSGNLYVADGGNNRIIRFPKPLNQTGQLLAYDLVIGQVDLSSGTANQGQSAASAKSLYFSNNSAPFRAGLAFDAQGNLWASDPGNNRVLMFNAADLTAGNNDPAAALVLGQSDFSTRTVASGVARNSKTFLANPSGLAFDPQGRLYVADFGYRVLVYSPPFTTGQAASRIMGIVLPTQAQPTPPTISDNTLGNVQLQVPPEGIFFVGNNPFVLDTGNARILKYDPYDQWPPESTLFSPKAIAVIGQASALDGQSNRGQPQPSNASFSGPLNAKSLVETNGAVDAVFAGTDLYVADAGNNRVLVFPLQAGNNFTNASRLLGQVDFKYNAVNLIEGREFFFQGLGGAVAVDSNSNPPHLYVSDPGNHRVLGYMDYRKVTAGSTADLVIGQPDLYTAEINYPQGSPAGVNGQGLYNPEGVAVDSSGNLWVVDSGNGRVVRYATPFGQPGANGPQANLVLGQPNLFTKIQDASSQTMRTPFGIAFTANGSVLVSDNSFNRILFFAKPQGGDFSTGQAASSVIGQPDFGPPSEMTLNAPRLISVDSDDRLYVADSGNNRIAIYRNVPTAGNDPTATFSLAGLNSPFGVAVNQYTGEIWVSDFGSNHLFRYPRFDTLVLNPTSTVTVTSFGPLGVGLDSFGNPISVESINRVAFFYPAIDYTSAAGGVAGRFSGNAANYFERFAPGMLASIFAFVNTQFGQVTAGASTSPLPTTLADVQVFVNGVAAPLLYASPGQINFQVPSNAPVGSTPVEFQVVKASTGQVLASGLFRIEPVSPGLFTADSTGSGQLAALNQDGTINGPLHPAKAGTYISFFGTGIGPVSGGPPDGAPSPNQPVPSASQPDVYINGVHLAPGDVQYSGLAPGFIGLWQVNAKIPATVPTPDVAVPVAILYQGISSRADVLGNARVTTIRTTP